MNDLKIWLIQEKVKNPEIRSPFTGDIYFHEYFSLSFEDRSKLEEIWLLWFYMCSDDYSPGLSWNLLQGGHRELFLRMFEMCRERDLKNIQKWLGRKYNMLYNIPRSFEVFQGRIYDVTL